MEIDPDVLGMVRRQLERDPPPSTTALYGRATRLNRDIYQLSLRQFHAMYPLRVKREKARDGGGDPDAGATLRSRVRGFFFGMARDVVDADEPGDVVELVQGLDVRVDELIRLLEERQAVS